MQDNPMQVAVQPYIRLVQRNMELLQSYSMSPEALSQALANPQSLFTPGQGPATNAAQSRAFAELVQGMIRNYTEFMAEVGQTGMELMAQGQAALVEQTRQMTEQATGAAETRGRRQR